MIPATGGPRQAAPRPSADNSPEPAANGTRPTPNNRAAEPPPEPEPPPKPQAPAQPDPPEPGTARWRALGSWVQLAVDPHTAVGPARGIAARLLDSIETACSRFRPDSDLSRANRNAGSWVSVSPLLAQAVVSALAAAGDTDGLVDPTLALSLESLGYDRDLDRVRSQEIVTAVPRPALPGGWRSLSVDAEGALRVPAGTGLDLGAIGKAFAVDLVAARVASQLDVDLVIDIGGDVAIGTRNGTRTPVPWLLPVEGNGLSPELVRLSRGGLATSCVERNTWYGGGRPLHHLLDPFTGEPVRRIWHTAAVVAPTCVAANTASAAAILLGDRAHAWLAARGLPARLVDRDGRVRYLGNWPAQEADV
ncbi:MAG: FAD:protein transferase [Actinomycetota bacterium]|nr:FAD:protein transferase [Actinomycetota bacterium]